MHELGNLILIGGLLFVGLDGLRRWLNFQDLIEQDSVLLEITPPLMALKSPLATSNFFIGLHNLGTISKRRDRLMHRVGVSSLEIVADRTNGIRFLMRVADSQRTQIEQHLNSYLPGITIAECHDYLISQLMESGLTLMEFKLANHYVFGLQTPDKLSQHDPLSYLSGQMANLAEGELVALQIVAQPYLARDTDKLRTRLLSGQATLGNQWHGRGSLSQLLLALLKLPLVLIKLGLSYWLKHSGYAFAPSNRRPAVSQVYSPALVKQQTAFMNKLSQPLFQTTIRALVVSPDTSAHQQRVSGLVSALSSFNSPGQQYLITKSSFPKRFFLRYRLYCYRYRLPAVASRFGCILSASELGGLFHFPYGTNSLQENVSKSFNKTLPAPVSLKHLADNHQLAVVLGENLHHGQITPVGLTSEERQRHVYIIGGTGNGKTTMLESGLIQDISAGRGVALIDPHGDLATKLLEYIPNQRLKDVIYLNPRDLDKPIGLNLLELTPGLSGSDLLHEKDLVAEAVISVLRKIFDDGQAGQAYRIERVLRNAIHTAFTIEGATLFTVLRLMSEANYRKSVVRRLEDPSLKRFWQEELGKAGDFQKVKITSGPISRIERFERSVVAKRMLGQVESTISFDDIINSQKILICNFSKGKLGEDTSNLLGATVLAKLQLAAWKRDELKASQRIPFYLYVDEFQNFASDSFLGLFSEARKYKLFLTMAQQSVAQLSDQAMMNTILDNVGTLVVFRSKSLMTEQVVLHQLKPFVAEGQIANLDSFNFIMKLAAVHTQEPFTGRTIVSASPPSGSASFEQVAEASRNRWGRNYVQAETGRLVSTILEDMLPT